MLSSNAKKSLLGLPASVNARKTTGWRGTGIRNKEGAEMLIHPDLRRRVARAAMKPAPMQPLLRRRNLRLGAREITDKFNLLKNWK